MKRNRLWRNDSLFQEKTFMHVKNSKLYFLGVDLIRNCVMNTALSFELFLGGGIAAIIMK